MKCGVNILPRVCPGKWFADSNIWLLASNIIAMFNIEKALDDSGEPITPLDEFTVGTIRYGLKFLCVTFVNQRRRHPKEFLCKISYRSENARRIVEEANALQN